MARFLTTTDGGASLTALDLSSNRIGCGGAENLAAALPRHAALTQLCLRNNGIASAGAAALVRALACPEATEESVRVEREREEREMERECVYVCVCVCVCAGVQRLVLESAALAACLAEREKESGASRGRYHRNKHLDSQRRWGPGH